MTSEIDLPLLTKNVRLPPAVTVLPLHHPIRRFSYRAICQSFCQAIRDARQTSNKNPAITKPEPRLAIAMRPITNQSSDLLAFVSD